MALLSYLVTMESGGFFMSPKLTISVKEARKLLGKTAQEMSDNQITALILTLTDVADNFLQDLGSTNYTG